MTKQELLQMATKIKAYCKKTNCNDCVYKYHFKTPCGSCCGIDYVPPFWMINKECEDHTVAEKELLGMAKIIEKHCDLNHCDNCYFNCGKECGISNEPKNWKVDNAVCTDATNQRIAELHRELDIRDRRIEELEQQLVIKNSIVKKQGVMLTELQENQFVWHSADEEPPTSGMYLCYFRDSDSIPTLELYECFIYYCHAWSITVPKCAIFTAWAEIPPYEMREND